LARAREFGWDRILERYEKVYCDELAARGAGANGAA
jgi:hypothetical protein